MHSRIHVAIFASACLAYAMEGGAEILRLGDLSAPQLRALDRSKTIVLLTGGIRRGEAVRLARLSRITAPREPGPRREDLGRLHGRSRAADTEDSRRREPVDHPPVRRPPRKECDLPVGVDRAVESAMMTALV
jgi:hypothetical protein